MSSSLWIEPGAALNPSLPLSKSELAPLVARLLDVLGLAGASVEVRMVDDAEIARLNLEFLGLPGPTNVLSFPAEDDERPDYLGEIALSVDTLTREAVLYGQDPAGHLVRLLAHGLLHLAGYDHGQVMEEMTDMAVESVA
ncbi:rRNA maturation RNase YbeY [Fundidesulfovibrio terrae]|uniref:rRNA maturation RNase YbeY n=1 Tax=Fundidesulfovibrio terrae TaxID=2922866 RepID=UPI001FAEE5E3|nr:rRNA maturation RNase YbeY [Fundidesulfovibrio terrae]